MPLKLFFYTFLHFIPNLIYFGFRTVTDDSKLFSVKSGVIYTCNKAWLGLVIKPRGGDGSVSFYWLG